MQQHGVSLKPRVYIFVGCCTSICVLQLKFKRIFIEFKKKKKWLSFKECWTNTRLVCTHWNTELRYGNGNSNFKNVLWKKKKKKAEFWLAWWGLTILFPLQLFGLEYIVIKSTPFRKFLSRMSNRLAPDNFVLLIVVPKAGEKGGKQVFLSTVAVES